MFETVLAQPIIKRGTIDAQAPGRVRDVALGLIDGGNDLPAFLL